METATLQLLKSIGRNNMAWVAVDKDGTEKIFNSFPIRRSDVNSILFASIVRNFIRKKYSKNNYKKWDSMWSTDENDPMPENAIVLPKGSIKKLIGRDLTWQDEPVELKEE